jgi:flagellar biogenesis protein FliO
MLAPLLLASMTAAPVVLSDISATRDATSLSVTIASASPLAVEAARGEVREKSLRILVLGATLPQPERLFRNGRQTLRARRYRGEVVIEVPIDARIECRGPVQMASTPLGLRASAACGERGAMAKEKVELESLLALPAAGDVTPKTPEVTAVEGALAPAPKENAQAIAMGSSPSVSPAPALDTVAKSPAVPAEPAPIEQADSSKATIGEAVAGPRNLVVPAIVLAALGGAALFFSRRRARGIRMLEIVETASLGPRRSLVVARVGGETLLIASGESGISLLSVIQAGAVAAIPRSSLASAIPPPVSSPRPAPQKADLGVSQAGLLARMLGSRPKIAATSFDALLAESAEDQELRQKLAAGMVGRVA